jgi:hypothetical protein
MPLPLQEPPLVVEVSENEVIVSVAGLYASMTVGQDAWNLTP